MLLILVYLKKKTKIIISICEYKEERKPVEFKSHNTEGNKAGDLLVSKSSKPETCGDYNRLTVTWNNKKREDVDSYDLPRSKRRSLSCS